MITRIEALHYRCLRWVSQPLGRFHVMIGPNASGKTTFLDGVGFLSDLMNEGLDGAVSRRTLNFQDLLWQRPEAGQFGLAIELAIPHGLKPRLRNPEYSRIRYEIEIGLDAASREYRIQAERATLISDLAGVEQHRAPAEPDTLLLPWATNEPVFVVLNKDVEGNDTFYPEIAVPAGQSWNPAFRLGPRRSALAKMPEDESLFPVATWLRNVLAEGVQLLRLDSLQLRRASPPGRGPSLLPDGSNLPWVVAELERRHPERIRGWLAHLKSAIPELEGIRVVERPDDKHRYLVLQYMGGLEVPSWMASDGTLRLLALTLLAYIPELQGILLIEEPENGIHPRAVETLFQSLSSVYDAQVLLATHSPIVLGIVQRELLLCFSRATDGSTNIVAGHEHPLLRDWNQEPNLSTLFAAGVLG